MLNIMKCDKDSIVFNINNNTDKFHTMQISGTKDILSKIATQVENVANNRIRSDQYSSNEDLICQSKKLLERIVILANGILNSSDPKKSATNALDKIHNILEFENNEFMNVIKLHEGDSYTPAGLRPRS